MVDCEFCAIIEGELESDKIYEDEEVIAVLNLKPAIPGQAFIFPKEHHPVMEQVPDGLIGHVFNVASKISTVIFETLNSQGTNLLIQNGVAAGQGIPHFSVNIIPRLEEDNLNLRWKPKDVEEDQLDVVQHKLEEQLSDVHPSGFGQEKQKEEKNKSEDQEEKSETKKLENTSEEENYLIKQLERTP